MTATAPWTSTPSRYSEPVLVRERLERPEALDHELAMEALVGDMLESHPIEHRSVFVGHAFVQGATSSESERPLSVGSTGAVSASNFRRFDYAALGHLHRPQSVPNSRVRYAGALLRYSFDEVGQQRSVTVVEMDGEGRCRTEDVALSPRRDLRVVEGTMDDLLRNRPAGSHRDDFVLARLLGRDLVLDAMGKLRAVYPNIMAVDREALELQPGPGGPASRRTLTYAEAFSSFFKEVTGNAPTRAEAAVFASVASALASDEREVRA